MSPAAAERPSVETHLLLRLLGQTENGHAEWGSGLQWDCQAFADACDFHQVSALVLRRLDALPEHAIPTALSAQLRDRFYKISLTNYLLANRLVALTSLLEAENIPVLAYKGPAVAVTVYGDLALRQYQDLDLVVHLEQLPNAIQTMKRAGFRLLPDFRPENPRDLRQFCHATFHAPDRSHYVELHWQLVGNLWHAFSPAVEKVWGRSETLQLPHGRVSTMCREDLFLILCCHGATHRWSHLKWLADVAELLRSTRTWDWSRIEEMIGNQRGVAASASLGILLAHELLGAPVPIEAARILPMTERVREVAEAIRQQIWLHGRTDGDPHRTLLGLEERRAARIKYRGTQAARYTSWWFRQVTNVCPMDREWVPLPEQLEFLYLFIRPLRLAVKYSSRAAQALWSLARRGSIRTAISDRL